ARPAEGLWGAPRAPAVPAPAAVAALRGIVLDGDVVEGDVGVHGVQPAAAGLAPVTPVRGRPEGRGGAGAAEGLVLLEDGPVQAHLAIDGGDAAAGRGAAVAAVAAEEAEASEGGLGRVVLDQAAGRHRQRAPGDKDGAAAGAAAVAAVAAEAAVGAVEPEH